VCRLSIWGGQIEAIFVRCMQQCTNIQRDDWRAVHVSLRAMPTVVNVGSRSSIWSLKSGRRMIRVVICVTLKNISFFCISREFDARFGLNVTYAARVVLTIYYGCQEWLAVIR
jgi:hypothetical protein